MNKLMNGLKRFVREEDAPTMAEYGLLLVFIALVVVGGAAVLGTNLNTLFNNTGTAVGTAASGTPTMPTPGS